MEGDTGFFLLSKSRSVLFAFYADDDLAAVVVAGV
jgi:hypothetical protein